MHLYERADSSCECDGRLVLCERFSLDSGLDPMRQGARWPCDHLRWHRMAVDGFVARVRPELLHPTHDEDTTRGIVLPLGIGFLG